MDLNMPVISSQDKAAAALKERERKLRNLLLDGSDQWKTSGQCVLCRKKPYCGKACSPVRTLVGYVMSNFPADKASSLLIEFVGGQRAEAVPTENKADA